MGLTWPGRGADHSLALAPRLRIDGVIPSISPAICSGVG